MRKILLFAIMAVFMFACSDDETTELLQPTIEDVTFESASVGDIIIIPGKDFNENGVYSVKFNEVGGKVIEINPTYLKVEVPEDATTGDITLTYDGVTIKVGAIIITKFPTIESITPVKVKIGDIVTITGSDFTIGETYIVKFKELKAIITEVDPIFLKVQVPEGADTGELTLTYKDESKVIGNVEIEAEISILYAFKTIEERNSEVESSQLITIDPLNGTETILQTINDIEAYYPVFDNTTNRIFAVYGNEAEDEDDDHLLIFDLSDNTHSAVNLTSDNENQYISYELVVGKDGILYAFKTIEERNSEIESSQLITIDPLNGTETILQTISDIEAYYPVFDNTTNRIFAVYGNEAEDEGEDDDQLLIFDLSDNTHSAVNLASDNENQYISYELVVGKDGILYAFKTIEERDSNEEFSQLITIDPLNGTETILQTINDIEAYCPVFDNVTDRIYAVYGNEGEDDDQLLILDSSDNTHSMVNLTSDNENQYITYELVIGY